MDAEEPQRPADDTTAARDDSGMESGSNEEGSAEAIPPGGGALHEGTGASGTTTTEAEMEDASKTSEPATETKDSAESSKAETETQMKDTGETLQPTSEVEEESKGSTGTSQRTAETEAEMKESTKTPMPEIAAGPSPAALIAEMTSSSETPEQSGDDSSMDTSSLKPPRPRGPKAAKRHYTVPLGKRRRPHHLTSDEDVSSTSSSSFSPAVKHMKPSVSSDSEDSATPAERALAEARALELEHTVGGSDIEISELSSFSGSVSATAGSTPDVSDISERSTPLNLPEEELGEEARASGPQRPTEGARAGVASRSSVGKGPKRPREPESPRSQSATPLTFAEGALQSSSGEDVKKPLVKWPASLCLASSGSPASSLSSLTDSETGGGAVGTILPKSVSFQDASTAQTCPVEKGRLTRSQTFAGSSTSPASTGEDSKSVSFTLRSSEMLTQTPAGGEAQEEMEQEAEPSTEAGASGLGASSHAGGTSGAEGTIPSTSGEQHSSTSGSGSGPQPTPMESEESESDESGQQASALGHELVTAFRGPDNRAR